MTTAAFTLTLLAQRFDDLASVTQGVLKRKAQRHAKQLRDTAHLTIHGHLTTDQAWNWADRAAGQLITNNDQLDRKAKR